MLRCKLMRLMTGQRLRADEHGASLLEMTVVTPFLLTIGLGVFEFGNALYNYHLITAGVRDAGRYLSGLRNRGTTETDNAKKIAICGRISPCNTADRRVSWWGTGDIDISYCIEGVQVGASPPCTCNNGLGLLDGTSKVCVRTSVAYDDVGFLGLLGPEGILGSSGLGPITITTSHEERYYASR
jgi:hypothetical protein